MRTVTDLWHGRVPLARAFWEFLILYGLIANLLATGASMAAVALDWPAAVAVALYLLPLPYLVLAVTAVWRSAAERPDAGGWATAARAASLAWAALMLAL